MMQSVKIGVGVAAALFLVIFGWNFVFPSKEIPVSRLFGESASSQSAKTLEERMKEAQERSANVKGLYMTADVAGDQGAAGTRLRNNLIRIAERTEINGFVIDVKEACGIEYNEPALKNLLEELHGKNLWAIARIVVMSDSSEIDVHPEWYLTRKSHKAVGGACANKKYLRGKAPDGKKSDVIFWRDKSGKYWIDPASDAARAHIVEFSKRMIDLGFDELQYDYIRFPSDGDIENAVYPSWDGKTGKCRIVQSFYEYLNKNLKSYKPEIILSADFFGYAAVGLDTGIGQCLDSLEDSFDFVSFMTYPSHYYSGFHVPALRGLPQIDYRSSAEARAHPDVIAGRSTMFSRDFFDGKIDLSGRPASTTIPAVIRSQAKLRPWIEDFFHEADQAAKRPFGAEKVRAQIDATEAVEPHGWLLWNAGNVYSEGALKRE